MLTIIKKISIFLLFASIVWSVPMYFRLEVSKDIASKRSLYEQAIFKVTRTHEVGARKGSRYPDSSYLEGDITLGDGRTFSSQFYDTGEVFKLGHITKKYNKGRELKVLFSQKQLARKNGKTPRVIDQDYFDDIDQKLFEKEVYTYGPFTLMLIIVILLRLVPTCDKKNS